MEQTQKAAKSSVKAKVQKLGSTLSSMVMPNIGALIAWGVLTALFIPDGYLPNEAFATMVGPMLTYLIPILIGYTGGKVIAGDRGAVVGAIATMGVIVGTDIPMLLGAMIMGPLGGWVIKKFDEIFQDKVRAGFEMLVNNFSSGLIGFALALLGFVAIGPVVNTLTEAMAAGVEVIVNAHLIPLANIFIEPAKILFLNNAINHGILTPLGTEQVSEFGKSILYLLEANPGPGLGVLLAFTFFGKGAAKSSAPGAIIIHFIGGIHEIYFPYVMMKPLMFLAVIAGGVSAGVSFIVAAAILKADAKDTVDNFEEKVQQTQAAKLSSKGLAAQPMTGINRIIFACDAGMGSSAMGASILRKKVKEAGLPQNVSNSAINNLTDDANTLIVTQEELQERAKQKAPNATFVAVENFLNSPRYDEIVATLSGTKTAGETAKKSEAGNQADVPSANDLKQVSEIILAHDDRKGSATMAQKVFQDLLAKEALTMPIRKSHINDLHANASSLVITKEALTPQAQTSAPEAIHLSVNNLMGTTNYQRIVASIKAAN